MRAHTGTVARVKARGQLAGVSPTMWILGPNSGPGQQALFPTEPTSSPFYTAQARSCPLTSKTQAPFLQTFRVCALISPPLPNGLRTFLTSVSNSLTKLSFLPVGPYPPARGPSLLVLFCQDQAGSTSPAFGTFSRPEFYPTCHIILTG